MQKLSFRIAVMSGMLLLSVGCGKDHELESLSRNKNWRDQMVCVATVPANPDGPAYVAAVNLLRANKIVHCAEGSVAWAIYVLPRDAERARNLLRSSASFRVVSENRGVLRLEPKPAPSL